MINLNKNIDREIQVNVFIKIHNEKFGELTTNEISDRLDDLWENVWSSYYVLKLHELYG